MDGEWKYAPDQPAMYDEMGNVNNVLEVQEYVPVGPGPGAARGPGPAAAPRRTPHLHFGSCFANLT